MCFHYFYYSFCLIPNCQHWSLVAFSLRSISKISHHMDLLYTKNCADEASLSHVYCVRWETAPSFFIDSLGPGISFNNSKTPILLLSSIFSRLLGGCLSSFSLGAVKSIWQLWFMTQHRHRAPVGKSEYVWMCLEVCECARVGVRACPAHRGPSLLCSMLKRPTEHTGREVPKTHTWTQISRYNCDCMDGSTEDA